MSERTSRACESRAGLERGRSSRQGESGCAKSLLLHPLASLPTESMISSPHTPLLLLLPPLTCFMTQFLALFSGRPSVLSDFVLRFDAF
jgi:hypothetical protein